MLTNRSNADSWQPAGILDKFDPLVGGPRGGVPRSTVGSSMGGRMATNRGSFLFHVSAHLFFNGFVVGHDVLSFTIGVGRVSLRWERLGYRQLTLSAPISEIFLVFCYRVVKTH